MSKHFRIACLVATLVLPTAALAQADGDILSLELNAAAETAQGNCRLTYVAKNGTPVSLSQTEYEVAIFDADGTVSRLLVLKFGSLVPGKTRILQFELPGTSCANISRIVINDSAACVDADTAGDIDVCMTGLSASSRTAIQFGI
ncbi:hypothetical protein RGUI_3060 [Rhodovulum sp. P5]|uniref:hypothetical protein n=1 Tax=Rhodovulum sp. P5 TaxID=1564506 RepID=UPI0009C2501C|nr:hypothetical protein [Rhodovulum sp. P5]ARE41201.1 hypothetical protein RGUI_3060 [Rhodovulum sp. P5]